MMHWGSLLIFIGLVGATAFFGGQWGANDWYRNLRKPGFTPPNWLFPVAWSVLYLLIAMSGWLVWDSQHDLSSITLCFWGGQLLANAIWSYLFFGRKNLKVALIDIGILWLFIGLYTIFSFNIDTYAAFAFIPYWIWVSYAGLLNWKILQLNPGNRPIYS